MKYAKYHGLGNDYLVIEASEIPGGTLSAQQIVSICDRHFGVGSDGIILLEEEQPQGFIVRVFNPDGSEAESSGNGMRIVSRYLYDTERVRDKPFTLLVRGERAICGRIIDPLHAVEVDMGKATFLSSQVPVIGDPREVILEPIEIEGHELKISCVNVGNPHCVIFGYPDLKRGAQALGPVLEMHEYFPQRINVQFAQVIDRANIRIEIWERGAGYTFASGTSSCAAASVARKLGLVDSKVTVHMPGGSLTVEISDNFQLKLTGPVTRVCSGSIDEEIFLRQSRRESLHAEGTTLLLQDLLKPEFCTEPTALQVLAQQAVHSITADSREVQQGSLFFAISGAKVDARVFIDDALKKGAVAVVCEATASEMASDSRVVRVSDVRRALSYAAHIFFGKPSLATTNIAVTGTSGKTSVSWILAHALHGAGVRTFLGGTLGYQLLQEGDNPARGLKELGNTSIDPISVHRLLVDAVRSGAQASVFEATSQGIVQRRMRDVAWDIAIFTNLTRDHLDLHGTMEAYEAAKRELFTTDLSHSPKSRRVAIINCDDPVGIRFADALRGSHPEIQLACYASTAGTGIDFVLSEIHASAQGVSLRLIGTDDTISLSASFVGRHNAYNLASVAIAMYVLGYKPKLISQLIGSAPVVPGRVEVVAETHPKVFIDYAHKPDALEKVLRFLKPLCLVDGKQGRLINVFGCGGERDTGKRPVMGEISYRLADVSIVTSDNPRSESPQGIIEQIVSGINQPTSERLFIEVDRKKAIYQAIEMARPDDIVVIAGKGHEPYQEISGVKHPFCDMHIAREALDEREKNLG